MEKQFEEHIHFIGCGGIGMFGLALLSIQHGNSVSGSDIQNNKNTELLKKLGATVYLNHSIDNLSKVEKCTIVYSSAISSCNPELIKAKNLGFKCYRRGEFLAILASNYKRVVAIAGSHGKTTVTAMISHIMKELLQHKVGYLVGGWPIGEDYPGQIGNGDIFIIEVDESDLSLELIHSYIGVVLNLDDDHSWNVGGQDALNKGFITFAQQSELLIYDKISHLEHLFRNISSKVKKNISDDNSTNRLRLNWGEYQNKNAIMAINVAVELGVSYSDALTAVLDFEGVERRMCERFNNDQVIIIEDYAHHPVEIKASISAIRDIYKDRQLTVIIQPHRYARLKKYFEEFSKELMKADRVFVLPVFTAWILDKKKDSNHFVYQKFTTCTSPKLPVLTQENKNSLAINSKQLVENIGRTAEYVDGSWMNMSKKIISYSISENMIYLILGAGDINKLIPALIADIVASRFI